MNHSDIVDQLTLEQKCALLTGHTAFETLPIATVGLPAVRFSDGPHGLRAQSKDQDPNHMGLGQSEPATCFPPAATLAQSWDMDLLEKVGLALGKEAAAQGVNVLLGPGMNIKRSPLCGRNFEYFSEDPLLTARMATAYVKGVQKTGVAACIKHFALNSQETRRQASNSVVDERTMRELYLAAFEAVVREAKPQVVMTSYNKINGTYANENRRLLGSILRGEWGFSGAVVSDWGGANSFVAGVRAGSTLQMPACGYESADELKRAVNRSEVTHRVLDKRVGELVDLALSTQEALEKAEAIDEEAHHSLAREVAAAGIVLLKNEAPAPEEEPLLPLAKDTSVALIGAFATTPRYQGSGSSLVSPTRLDTLEESLKNQGVTIVGTEPGFDGTSNQVKNIEAVQSIAKKADVALVCLGLPEASEGEGLDRSDIQLPQEQIELLQAVVAANSKVAVVLSSGSVVDTSWAAQVPSLLYVGLGGQAGGSAAAEVLLGVKSPEGRLAETWPVALEDVPAAAYSPSSEETAAYREALFVGYRAFVSNQKPVAYPFGFGLTYTSFSYSDIALTNGGYRVSFTLTNTGERRGTEVAQAYVGKANRRVWGPARELRGFTKVVLDPKESKRISIDLDERAFSYYNIETGLWEVEKGFYGVYVGPHAHDTSLSARISIAGTAAPDPYEGLDLEPYHTAHVAEVSDEQFEELIGVLLPSESKKIDANFCMRNYKQTKSLIFRVVGHALERASQKPDKSGKPNTAALFLYNMPLRAFQKSSGGRVSMGMVDILIQEAQGWGFIGLIPAVIAAIVVGVLGRSIAVGIAALVIAWLLWTITPFLVELVQNKQRTKRWEKLLAQQEVEYANATTPQKK